MKNNFESFLQIKDNAEDLFDNWLSNLDSQELIDYSDKSQRNYWLKNKFMFHKIIEEQMEALRGFVKNETKEVSEEAEIDEGGEELDEEKIADAIDTEDLGARADYAYAQEVNK